MKNIIGFGNTGLNITNNHHENEMMQNHSNQPQQNIPAQPDKNPDPTRQRPGVNEPEKVDPTRINEPGPVDPTRIDNPPPGIPEQEPRKHLTIW